MSDSEPEVEYEPESFTIGGFALTVTTIAFMPIELLMKNRDKETEISGQKLWCGSLGVIQHILNNPHIVNGVVVVELGAGTGVLGMICKKLGAKEVILTDHDPISIANMVTDCTTNDVVATVERMDWYAYEPKFDWAVAPTERVLLAAGDVLYKQALIKPFFTTVTQLFAKFPTATMLLCHIPRAGVEQGEVVAAAQECGFVISEIPRELWSTGDLFEYCEPDDLARARLYSISLAP
jgi:predicted nicotinamide N-methyase